jgi:redox-sensitive bicupin YhaK (pirin superfamily)
MIEHRPVSSLGSANHGWLDAYHHFSVADYQDAADVLPFSLPVISRVRVQVSGVF